MDRWISILSQSFRARGVAAVALLRPGGDPEKGGGPGAATVHCAIDCRASYRPPWTSSGGPSPSARGSRTVWDASPEGH